MRWPWPGRSVRLGAGGAAPRWLDAASRLTASYQAGQAALEAAVTTLMSVMTIVVTLQLAIVAAQAFSAMYVAQTTARWLAVRIDTLDSAVVSQAAIFAGGLPGLSGGGLASVAVSPSCTTLSGGKCAGRESGDAITVTVTTSLTPVMFLPTTWGVPPYQFRLPTSMPAIAYTVLLE